MCYCRKRNVSEEIYFKCPNEECDECYYFPQSRNKTFKLDTLNPRDYDFPYERSFKMTSELDQEMYENKDIKYLSYQNLIIIDDF